MSSCGGPASDVLHEACFKSIPSNAISSRDGAYWHRCKISFVAQETLSCFILPMARGFGGDRSVGVAQS